MSKILIIGVGDSGLKAIIKMKENGIPNANYITFSNYYGREEAKEHDIPHYDLIEMNELPGISSTDNPKVFAKLAENVKKTNQRNNKRAFEIMSTIFRRKLVL